MLSLMANKAGLQGHSKKHLDGCEALMSAPEASPQTRHFVIATVMGQWEERPSHRHKGLCSVFTLNYLTPIYGSMGP